MWRTMIRVMICLYLKYVNIVENGHIHRKAQALVVELENMDKEDKIQIALGLKFPCADCSLALLNSHKSCLYEGIGLCKGCAGSRIKSQKFKNLAPKLVSNSQKSGII